MGMKWRSREAADELVSEYEASGMSRKRFCEQRGLSLGTLDLYRKRRRLAGAGAEPGCGLVRVKVSGEASRGWSGLQLVLSGGWRVEVGANFDEAALKRLLAVIERA